MQNNKSRTKTRVAVYVIGMKNNQLLLGKRINALHMNNCWSLPAGHVAEGESATMALIRECREELGIDVCMQDVQLIGAFHQFSDPYDYANYVFRVDLSAYEITNNEPLKCAGLRFFDPSALPNPMHEYITWIIKKSIHGPCPWIDEIGF